MNLTAVLFRRLRAEGGNSVTFHWKVFKVNFAEDFESKVSTLFTIECSPIAIGRLPDQPLGMIFVGG